MIAISLLRELIRYDPETGKLFWLPRPESMFPSERIWRTWTARYVGSEALTALSAGGYLVGAVLNRRYAAHRIAFAVHHGMWPSGQIDHINGVKTDNRILNLRDVSRAVNMQNASLSAANTSGVTGVYWTKRERVWLAQIVVNNRQFYLGSFSSFDEAVAARKAAEIAHGFHPNHGRKVA